MLSTKITENETCVCHCSQTTVAKRLSPRRAILIQKVFYDVELMYGTLKQGVQISTLTPLMQ